MTRHLRPDVDANSGVLVFNLPQSNYQKVHESVARRQKNLTPITNLYLKLTLHGDVTELDIASSLLHCSIKNCKYDFLIHDGTLQTTDASSFTTIYTDHPECVHYYFTLT